MRKINNMDQFYLDSVELIAFMAVWFIFAICTSLIHFIYRIYKTKKIGESFDYIFKMHARMFIKFYMTTMLFFVFCIIIKSIIN